MCAAITCIFINVNILLSSLSVCLSLVILHSQRGTPQGLPITLSSHSGVFPLLRLYFIIFNRFILVHLFLYLSLNIYVSLLSSVYVPTRVLCPRRTLNPSLSKIPNTSIFSVSLSRFRLLTTISVYLSVSLCYYSMSLTTLYVSNSVSQATFTDHLIPPSLIFIYIY